MSKKRQTINLADQIGTSIGRVDQTLDRLADEEQFLRTLTIRTPEEGVGDYFVVMRWWVGNQEMVAFHSAGSFWEALKGAADRMHNGSLSFKPDKYGANRDA